MIDGQQQRRALTAAEQALHALEAGEADRATEAAARAAALDQVGLFAALPGVVASAAAQIWSLGAVSPAGWAAIAAALEPGPLAALAAGKAGD
ncbi:MAG TPA: hypothetical protein VGB41_03020 [Acidimicrobiia bacterium]